MQAVGLGRANIAEYILYKHSKAVNIKDNEGRTPLHYAYCLPPENFTPLYNKLLKAGANENLIDKVCILWLWYTGQLNLK